MLEQRHPANERNQQTAWLLSIVITLIGAVSWNFYSQDVRLDAEIKSHVSDGHPYTVLAEIVALRQEAKTTSEKLRTVEADQKSFDMASARDRGEVLANVSDLQQHQVITATQLRELTTGETADRHKIEALETEIERLASMCELYYRKITIP